MLLKCSVLTCLLLAFISTYAQYGKKILKVTDFKDGRKLDTIMSYYNSKNQLIRIDNSYGYTFNYYRDSFIEKTLILNKEKGMKGCIDTMQSQYIYNKNNQLIIEVMKSNKCPQQPGGTDGHFIYKDTLQKPLSFFDSIVYNYDKAGRLIEKNFFSNLDDTSQYIRISYKYDDEKRKLEEKENYEKGPRYLKSFNYTDSSIVTDALWYYIIVYGKPLHDTTEEIQNSKGRLIVKKYSSNSNYLEKTYYIYDNLGRLKLENTISTRKRGLVRVVKYYYFKNSQP